MSRKKIPLKQFEAELASKVDPISQLPAEFQLHHKAGLSAFVAAELKKVDKRPPHPPPTAKEIAKMKKIRRRVRKIAHLDKD